MAIRVTQAALEILEIQVSSSRVTQDTLEIVNTEVAKIRITQSVLEIISSVILTISDADLNFTLQLFGDPPQQYASAECDFLLSLTGEYDKSNFGLLTKLVSLTGVPPASSSFVGTMVVNVDLKGTGLPNIMIGKLDINVDLTGIPTLNGTGEDCLTADDNLPSPSGTRFNRWFI